MKTGKDRVEEKQTDVERKTIKQRLMTLVFVTVSEWERKRVGCSPLEVKEARNYILCKYNKAVTKPLL